MLKKDLLRLKRHKTIRLKMCGTSLRPRLIVRRSLLHFYAVLVDDVKNTTLISVSTNDKEIKQKLSLGSSTEPTSSAVKAIATGGNVKAARFLGEIFAAKAKEAGFTKVVFDRAGYLYHGRVKAFVEALRKKGMEL